MRTNQTFGKLRILHKSIAFLLVAIIIFGILPVAAFTAAAQSNGEELPLETEKTMPPVVMGTVTIEELEVRSEPSAAADVLKYLAIDTRIEILEQKTVEDLDWGRIEEGWVDLTHVSLDEPTTPVNETPEPTGPATTEPPVTETPASEPPVSEPPASKPPATEPPATEPPATEPPATEPPATEPPATEPPATEPPASEPPASEPPASEPPASEPPATEPPATEPPASEPPASEPPATEPPATEPPATEPPATEPPATEPPATEPPATEPPATEPPATEPPETEPLETEPLETEPTEADESNEAPLTEKSVAPPTKLGRYSLKSSKAGNQSGLDISKTAMAQGDGTYKLELTLKGDYDKVEDSAKLDILLIVDRSRSMVRDPDTGEPRTRLAEAKRAANALIDVIESNSAIDAQYRIMEFSGSGHDKAHDDYFAKIEDPRYPGNYFKILDYSGWSSNVTTTKNWISKIYAFDGYIVNYNSSNYIWSNKIISIGEDRVRSYALNATNYEAVFRTINSSKLMNNSGRDDAMKVIVFLTDGDPTATWTWMGSTYEFGSTYDDAANVSRCMERVKDDMQSLFANRLYMVGFGEANLDNLEILAKEAKKVSDKFWIGSSESKLKDDMQNIGAEIAGLFYSNVTITDTLSHDSSKQLLVDIPDTSTVQVSVHTGSETYEGATVTLPGTAINAEAKLTASYNKTTGKLTLDFPDTYRLEQGYTYILSAVIKPTEAAYREYRGDDREYKDTPHADTGTHADNGQNGIFSNDSAKVTYTYDGETYDDNINPAAQYPVPVVQLDPGELVITKKIAGLTEAQIEALKLSFSVSLTYPEYGTNKERAEETLTIGLSNMEEEDGTYSYTIAGLSPDTDYTVTESFTTPDGYRATTTVNGSSGKTASGTVPKGTTKTVAYENTYKPVTTTVKVEKQVTGNLGDWEKNFSFTVSASGKVTSMAGMRYVKYSKNANGVPTAGAETEITAQTVSFSLKDNEYCIFYNVPLGTNLQIQEIPGDYILTKVEATNLNGNTLTRNDNSATLPVTAPASGNEPGHTVTFTNNRTATIDTGIALDSLPYILILVGVAAAGLFLLLRKARRFDD